MNANINRSITTAVPESDFSIDFETELTPVKLGRSGKVFYVDFNDIGFPVRLVEARDEIIAYLESKKQEYGYENITAPSPRLENTEDNLAALKELDTNIRSAINKAFGYDVCSVVFGVVFVTGITPSGECYYEKFLNAILPLIERQFDVRVSKFSTRAKAYTDRKGSHPALKR